MSDFQSLLSTFQAATGVQTATQKEGNDTKDKTLRELTSKLYNLSQLKKCAGANVQQPSSPSDSSTAPLHLAICLCIVDSLPHENIWKRWMENTNSSGNRASILIHAKHPEKVRSAWVQSKLLKHSYKPEWNDVRIIQAMLALCEKALEESNVVSHVVFGTESCIPIVPLREVDQYIQADKSYVDYYSKSQASRFDERRCWNAVEPYIPTSAIYKALPGWCCLSARHAREILDIPTKHLHSKPLYPAFEACWAPEECYFATCLALLGHLPSDDVVQRALTYAEWNERARVQTDRAHPKLFDDVFDARLVNKLRTTHQCVFLRKVKYHMPLERWQRAVEQRRGDEQGRGRPSGEESRHRRDERHKRWRKDDYYGHDEREDRHRHQDRRARRK